MGDAAAAGDEFALPDGPLWVFGYGSLCWKPDLPFAERFVGKLAGWRREFWQKSCDHRGTPGAPGLVAALVSDADAHTNGVAYRIPDDKVKEVLETLDFREKGGYTRSVVSVARRDGGHGDGGDGGDGSGDGSGAGTTVVDALIFMANEENPNYWAASPAEAAEVIATAEGPSGKNTEYLFRLGDFVRGLGPTAVAEEARLLDLERRVKERVATP